MSFFLILFKFAGQKIISTPNGPPVSPPPQQTNILRFYKDEDIPKGDTITLNGVTFNNFYNEGLPVGAFGEVLIYQAKRIKIYYFPLEKAFSIPITGYPFSDYQPLAEQALLNRLNISREDACKLNVYLTTAARIDSKAAGINHPLSWCENGE